MFSDLKLVPAFEDLNDEYMDLLRHLFEPFACHPGSIVLQQGAPADYLYLILNGKVEISFKPYDGTPITISYVKKGGWFGWSAVVGSRKYTSDRKSTRLNSSHSQISYGVFCLKKKKRRPPALRPTDSSGPPDTQLHPRLLC